MLRRLYQAVVVSLLRIHEPVLLAFLQDFSFREASGRHPEGRVLLGGLEWRLVEQLVLDLVLLEGLEQLALLLRLDSVV